LLFDSEQNPNDAVYLTKFEEAVLIPGAADDLSFLFTRKLIRGPCYHDLDDFINNKKKPSHLVDLISSVAAAVGQGLPRNDSP